MIVGSFFFIIMLTRGILTRAFLRRSPVLSAKTTLRYVSTDPKQALIESIRKKTGLKSVETNENSQSDDNLITSNEFSKLGLLPDIVKGLQSQELILPTPVQRSVIPRLLNKENLVMAAVTGSGKTYAYVLPIIQNLLAEEELGYERTIKRPRCLILVPTRELASQVLQTIKSISHYAKISSTGVFGGEAYAPQKKSLDKVLDIVVASPGRLLQHREQGNLYFSQVRTVIIDEVDTMLMQGFGADVRAVLRSVFSNKKINLLNNNNTKSQEIVDKTQGPHLVMATATLTKAVRTLLTDVENGGFNTEFADPSNPTPKKVDGTENRVKLNIVEVDGLHRSLPNVKHILEETKGEDKLNVLQNVLLRHKKKNERTLIFCNTIASCRAVEYSINEYFQEEFRTKNHNKNPDLEESSHSSFTDKIPKDTIRAVSYHGDLNSRDREINLEKFRNGDELYLVCSDIAARGLDIPTTTHVIMFDFPMNPIDYIHRAGRCGRAGRTGLVTSIVAKRDMVLAKAIKNSIDKGLPIDNLTANKKDYTARGKLSNYLTSKSETKKPSTSASNGKNKISSKKPTLGGKNTIKPNFSGSRGRSTPRK